MGIWDSIANLATSASQSTSGGSTGSQNISNSWSTSDAQSIANTWGSQASAQSAQEAERAHQRQKELLQLTMDYNTREAQKTRDWQTEMANTIYTRSAKNMEEAGINPILAAGFGLSPASVGSGATASIGTPSTFMGNTYADSNSASTSTSRSQGMSEGQSWGSQFAQSTSGLSTFLNQMGTTIEGLEDMMNGGQTVANIADAVGANAASVINAVKDVLKKTDEIVQWNSPTGLTMQSQYNAWKKQ